MFSVTFILVFSAMVSMIPAGLQGPENEADGFSPLDPNLVSAFTDSTFYLRANFTLGTYTYDFNSRTWLCIGNDAGFALGAKQLLFGWLWLGGMDQVKFVSPNNTDRGTELYLSEIEEDSSDGYVSYSLIFSEGSGASAGTWVIYWNSTLYANSTVAWLNDGLYITHGVGFESSAVVDIGTLLLQVLFFQLPDVPIIIYIIMIGPIWACIIYLIWYIIKEMIPFI